MQLYKYMSFESFVDLVQSKSLCFVYPPTWEDTYEGYLFRAIKTPNGLEKIRQMPLFSMKRDLIEGALDDQILNRVRYQCWSQSKDSVAMWSIYNYHKTAIMICTNSTELEKLELDGQYVKTSRIKYIQSVSLEDEVKRVFPTLKLYIPDLFMIKRKEFKHEREIRAHIGTNKTIELKVPLRVPILDLKSFIKGVMVHPSAESWFVDTVREYCRINKLKFLGQSNLYRLDYESLLSEVGKQ